MSIKYATNRLESCSPLKPSKQNDTPSGYCRCRSRTVTIAIGGVDKNGMMSVVVVVLMLAVFVNRSDFDTGIKASKDGGVGISTISFAIHLESSCCAAASFWWRSSIVRLNGIWKTVLKELQYNILRKIYIYEHE